ncbi:hypothetical protein BLOT_000246 [Blomia tropicalis]|nr:hypothetical protein BLOT_000246 [Blomia tropicalis]
MNKFFIMSVIISMRLWPIIAYINELPFNFWQNNGILFGLIGADAPARADILNYKQFNSKYECNLRLCYAPNSDSKDKSEILRVYIQMKTDNFNTIYQCERHQSTFQSNHTEA